MYFEDPALTENEAAEVVSLERAYRRDARIAAVGASLTGLGYTAVVIGAGIFAASFDLCFDCQTTSDDQFGQALGAGLMFGGLGVTLIAGGLAAGGSIGAIRTLGRMGSRHSNLLAVTSAGILLVSAASLGVGLVTQRAPELAVLGLLLLPVGSITSLVAFGQLAAAHHRVLGDGVATTWTIAPSASFGPGGPRPGFVVAGTL
jgi:hypothetical protein